MTAEVATPVKAWPKTTLDHRLEQCRAMLYLGGYISEAENVRIKRRIRRRFPLRPTEAGARRRR